MSDSRAARTNGWDKFLREAGPDRLLREVHVLRNALHRMAGATLAGDTPQHALNEQELVDRYVSEARHESEDV